MSAGEKSATPIRVVCGIDVGGTRTKVGLVDACGIAGYSTPWYLPNNLLREAMGVVKDFLVGNI